MKAGLETYRSYMGTAKVVFLTFFVFIVSQSSIVYITHGLGSGFLGIQLTFSHERFLQIATGWQAAGLLPDYYRHFILDYAHPLFYGVFLSSFMAFVFSRRGIPTRFNPLLLLPFLASFLDMAENTFHLFMLADFSRITPQTVLLSGTCTNLKWIVSFLCFAGSAALFFAGRKDKV